MSNEVEFAVRKKNHPYIHQQHPLLKYFNRAYSDDKNQCADWQQKKTQIK